MNSVFMGNLIPNMLQITMTGKCLWGMGVLDNARVKVEVPYILVGGCIPKKDTGEVVTVEFGAAVTGPLNANPGSKKFEVGKVGFDPVPAFEGGN